MYAYFIHTHTISYKIFVYYTIFCVYMCVCVYNIGQLSTLNNVLKRIYYNNIDRFTSTYIFAHTYSHCVNVYTLLTFKLHLKFIG